MQKPTKLCPSKVRDNWVEGYVRPDQEIQNMFWTIILYYYSLLNILTNLLSLKIALLF